MKTLLYPLQFQPILKEKIWGGEKLHKQLNKPSTSRFIGESWEVSTVPNSVSKITNGSLNGMTLQTVLELYKSELLGVKNYNRFGNNFPLLIKFIDAKQDLSIQLHPDDALAKTRHNSFGKTEMWYVMQADDQAKLIVGFNEEMDKKTYLRHLENKTLPQILNIETVEKGDAYFIEAGRIHAIGAGVMVAEIQQTSDVTYRVYDWDRKDNNGEARELHNNMAIDAFKFELPDTFKLNYTTSNNCSNKMIHCPYFSTNFIAVNSEINIENDKDSFLIYMCVEGEVSIITKDTEHQITKGQTILMPASIKTFTLKSTFGKLLEVYV